LPVGRDRPSRTGGESRRYAEGGADRDRLTAVG
jgi:hypothetical protein